MIKFLYKKLFNKFTWFRFKWFNLFIDKYSYSKLKMPTIIKVEIEEMLCNGSYVAVVAMSVNQASAVVTFFRPLRTTFNSIAFGLHQS